MQSEPDLVGSSHRNWGGSAATINVIPKSISNTYFNQYVRSDIYGYYRMSTAHLYSVPVLAAFDAIRNCSHCRRDTDDNCKAWREARESVAVLMQEARRLVKGVDELRDATGGCAATIYQFACGSVAYFAPDAPDFQEAGELRGEALARALRILEAPS